MRIAWFLDAEGQEHYGMDDDSKVGDSISTLQGDIFSGLELTGKSANFGQTTNSIIPCNIYCIGLNYSEHAAESGMEEPERPIVFAKPTRSYAIRTINSSTCLSN